MPQVVIQTLVWKRPEITKIHFDNLRDTGLPVYVGVSEDWAEELCKEYKFNYIRVSNHKVGFKKNTTVNFALQDQWDYMIEMGSDDLFIPSLFDDYLDNINKNYDCFGTKDIYFADITSHKAIEFSYDDHGVHVIGAGRTTKREFLEHTLWYNHINKGLDTYSEKKLIKLGGSVTCIDNTPPIICDFKSDVNIWSFDKFEGTPISYYELLDMFPNQKEELLKL